MNLIPEGRETERKTLKEGKRNQLFFDGNYPKLKRFCQSENVHRKERKELR